MPPLLAKNRMLVDSYPPFLSDLTPCNFFFIFVLRDETGFEREVAVDIAEVQCESLAALDSISIEDFRQYF
jgi:hypothetical protein